MQRKTLTAAAARVAAFAALASSARAAQAAAAAAALQTPAGERADGVGQCKGA